MSSSAATWMRTEAGLCNMLYLYLYLYIYICATSISIYIYICSVSISMYIYIYMYICMYLSLYIYIFTSIYIYIYVYIYIYMYVCMYVRMYVCMYVSIYIYIYINRLHRYPGVSSLATGRRGPRWLPAVLGNFTSIHGPGTQTLWTGFENRNWLHADPVETMRAGDSIFAAETQK